MNADPAVQLRLLDLQAADTSLAQLAHRRRSLPELAAITEHRGRLTGLEGAVVDAQTTIADIELEQRRLENDVDTVRTRTGKDQARLQAGGLPPRELSGLEHEIATLARRQSTLEDELLEVMERGETAADELRVATAARDEVLDEMHALEARRDEAFGEIDAAVAGRTPEREAVAAALPADLLALYEKSRSQGGTGAALLRQRRCEGCRIEASGSELSALRKAEPDAVVRCENCRAILVRTAESGL
ncbi:zinc ribbon domain-containing protein [Jatrophihabitans endophyticus]|uniref:zinc ribbon domain-containing protein n=1 Tax=Jatrophihabitans endophyticus TaxID=1206085 RepID=UPI0019E29CE8|nr:C4-type zinc ribbon domain-containing protein [Jatrophihabitans endophyticus]MBE7187935.1 hypothetical protein [Jatrophihabitans endophyticus]